MVIGIIVLVFGFVGALMTAKGFVIDKINEKYALLGAGFLILIISMIFMYKIMELKA
jgi:glucose uptake protein GlcU